MANHDVALKMTTELPVGGSDLEIPVKRNGRRIGVFTVNSNGVSWNPSTSKAATSVSWEDLPAALSGKPAAAPAPAPAAASPAAAAPAKKAAAKKASTPAKKTAAKKSAPAETPAAPEPTVEEAPAPAPAAPAAKKTAKKAAKKSTPAPAATTTTSAVDARAVRAWAAEKGIAVAPRGPISSSIIDQFRADS